MTLRRVLCALAWLASGCTVDEGPDEVAVSEDLVAFETMAQPALARSCAFPACHGSSERGLSLYAVGRHRLAPEPDLNDLQYAPLTAAEVHENLRSALLFVDPHDPDDSEILLRTIPVARGGRGHRGGPLYRDRDDPDFRSLARWVAEVAQ
jgi:hypothetical protein